MDDEVYSLCADLDIGSGIDYRSPWGAQVLFFCYWYMVQPRIKAETLDSSVGYRTLYQRSLVVLRALGCFSMDQWSSKSNKQQKQCNLGMLSFWVLLGPWK